MHEELLRKLNSKDKAIREEGIRVASSLPPDEFTRLVELEDRKYQTWILIAWIKAIVVFVCWLLFWTLLIVVIHKPRMMPIFAGMTAGIGMMILGYFRVAKMPLAHRAIAEIIESREDVRFVPAALSLLSDFAFRANKNLRNILIKLLPQLTFEQAKTWSDDQKQVLLTLLELPIHNTELTLAILKALEQIGDEWALKRIEQLAAIPDFSVMEKPSNISKQETIRRNKLIRQAAQECLPYIQTRISDHNKAQTLLRTSSPNVAALDTLLRTTITGNEVTAPEQLLHPH